ncbi:hypothetical protein MMC22_001556 [Lobaria immixta]|nr:hypothetical protein [Lobaria immixta]
MEFEVLYTLDNEEQFWEELDDIVSVHCQSHELIDNALRSYLAFTSEYKSEYLKTEHDLARCSFRLLESQLFAAQKDYVRMQMVSSILQEESADVLHLIVAFLLCDGRQNESTFFLMNEIGVFSRLVELIESGKEDESGLHKMMLELLYEMSRIQRLQVEELVLVGDESIMYLFTLIEELSDDVNDSYHYPLIKVLLVLNEQYMVAAHSGNGDALNECINAVITNKVIKVLTVHGSTYKSFGSIIILVLNRENETSLQLLILKLLYLLFTTPSTFEYFYTNDLRVLVDVIIRNLLDLPANAISLRHTYLRVLYPLLEYTQLKQAPHYKRDELRRLLAIMSGGGTAGGHFGSVDETTERLVARCRTVAWLEADDHVATATKNAGLLGVEMPSAMTSALSVVEVTAQREKPGVQTPSRGKRDEGTGGENVEDGDGNGNGVLLKPHGGATEMEAAEEKSPFEIEGEA